MNAFVKKSKIKILFFRAAHERRQLVVSLLPNIKKLNGGAPISLTEREDSERAFIRRFTPQDDKPDRYFKLSEKCVDKVWFKSINLIAIFSGVWYVKIQYSSQWLRYANAKRASSCQSDMMKLLLHSIK